MSCGRCGKKIDTFDPERCWFCMAPLCVECWDTFGHCGHSRADELNRIARSEIADDKNIPDFKLKAGSDDYLPSSNVRKQWKDTGGERGASGDTSG